jgi:arylsulfatase
MLVVQYGQILKKYDSAVLWDKWRLVHGNELYDVAADPGQSKNVIDKRPDLAKKLRAHYEKWWEKLEPAIQEYVPLTLGSPNEPSVRLTSSDWQDIYSDNAGHVRNAVGGPRGGWWNVLIDRDGQYEIALRRWPHEIDTALTGTPDPKGKAMPIAAAKLLVAGREFAAKSPGKDAREVVLTGRLPKGKTTLRAWFQDADGNDLCGAFYATVTWKGEK